MSTLQVDTLTSQDGTGSPDLPNGLAVTNTLTMNGAGDVYINRSVTSGTLILSGGQGVTGGSTSGGFVARGSSASYNASGVELYTNGSERFSINAAGNATFTGSITAGGGIDVSGTITATNLDVTGNGTFFGSTTETRFIEIGSGRSGDGVSYIDLIGDATYTDYGARFLRRAGANSGTELVSKGTGSFDLVTEEAGAITFSTSNTQRAIITAAGDIGIGTSLPGYKLEVNGQIKGTQITSSTASSTNQDASQSFVVREQGATGDDRRFALALLDGSGPTAREVKFRGIFSSLSYHGDSYHIWYTSAGEKLRLTTDSLGLNTSTFTNNYRMYIEGADQETGNITDSGEHGATLFLRAYGQNVGSGGAVAFGTTFGNATPFAAIKGFVTDGSTNTTGHLVFSTRAAYTDSFLTQRMVIHSDGKVGIGLSPAYSKLQVYEGGYNAYAVGGMPGIVSSGSYGGGIALDDGGVRSGFYAQDSGTKMIMYVGQTASDASGSKAVLTAVSSGKVGIGTSAPNQLLTLGSYTGPDTIGLDFETANITRGSILYNAGAGEMAFTSGYSGYGGYMTFSTNGAERMRIDASGNLLVGGTTNYYSGTRITTGNTGAFEAGLNIISSTAGACHVLFGDGASANAYRGQITYYNNTDHLGIFTANYERMRIDSSGRVGIGTSSPFFPIDVKTGTDTRVSLLEVGTAGAITALTDAGSSKEMRIGGLPLTFSGNGGFGSEHMRITSAGAVGIGDSSPYYSLSVRGAAQLLGYDTTSITENVTAGAYNFWSGATYSGVVTRHYGTAAAGTEFGLPRANLGTLIFQNVANGLVGTNGSTPLVFGTVSAERARIDQNGNFGLSTSNPTARIDARAAGSSPALGSTSGGILRLGEGTGGNGMEFGVMYDGVNPTYSHIQSKYLSGVSAAYALSLNPSGGFVGVGPTNPQCKLHVKTESVLGTTLNDYVATTNFQSQNGNQSHLELIQVRDSAGTDWTTAGVRLQHRTDSTYQAYLQFNGTGNTYGFSLGASAGSATPTGIAERFRLDSTGNFFFNCSTTPAGGVQGIRIKGTDTSQIKMGQSTGLGYYLQFYGASAEVGSIYTSGGTTTYATTSDYRLKENIVSLSDAVSRVKELNPVRFNFVDVNETIDGFIAHEVQDVVPEAVVGKKDDIDEEGNPVYQGLDTAKLVPLLTAALQEALAKIDKLEKRIEALEE